MEMILSDSTDTKKRTSKEARHSSNKQLNEYLRFGFLIHDVSRLRRILVDRELKPLGVTRSQWWVLAFLSRRDGMTQTALAADLDLTKVAVGGLLDRMETAGVVERRPDPNDGRIKRVYLTREGNSLVAKIRRHVDGVEAKIVDGLPAEDVDRTAKTLADIKHSLLDLIEDQGEELEGGFKGVNNSI